MTSTSDNLVSLRHPINFASANSTFWPEIAEGRTLDLTESDLAEKPIGSFEAWIQYTVFHFAKAGVPFTVSKNPIVGAINFVDTRSYGIRNYNPLAFTAALRGDGEGLCRRRDGRVVQVAVPESHGAADGVLRRRV